MPLSMQEESGQFLWQCFCCLITFLTYSWPLIEILVRPTSAGALLLSQCSSYAGIRLLAWLA